MTQTHSETSYVSQRVLKINVGFLLAEGSGYSRVTSLDIPQRLRLSEDTTVERLSGDLRLTRTSGGILVQGILSCTTLGECARCLTLTEITFPLEIEELFAPANSVTTQFTIGEDNILDLAPLIREEALVSEPHQVYCRPSCKGLCLNCGQNLNEGLCECQHHELDPRWAALAKLQGNLPNE